MSPGVENWRLGVGAPDLGLGHVVCGLTFLWGLPLSGVGAFYVLQPPIGRDGNLKVHQSLAVFMTI